MSISQHRSENTGPASIRHRAPLLDTQDHTQVKCKNGHGTPLPKVRWRERRNHIKAYKRGKALAPVKSPTTKARQAGQQ